MNIIEHSVIYKSESRYASFPLLNRDKLGNLTVGFFTAPKPDHCGIWWWNNMASYDEGKTWQEGPSLLPKNQTSFFLSPREISDCYTIRNKDSIIKTGSFGFRTGINNNKPQIIRSKYLSYAKITPNSIRESKYELPDTDNILTFPRFLLVQDNIDLIDVILIPAYSLVSNSSLSRCLVWRSDNGGKTFRLFNMFPDGINGNEMAFVQTDKGILAHIRSDDHPFLMESWSDDLGRTWSYPTIIRVSRQDYSQKVIGGPPHLLRLKDNRIVCSYGYRQSQPMGIRVIISDDEGETWQGPYIINEDGGYSSSLHKKRWFGKLPSPANDTGYPVSVQLKDESILTAYYITAQSRITHIAATKWRI